MLRGKDSEAALACAPRWSCPSREGWAGLPLQNQPGIDAHETINPPALDSLGKRMFRRIDVTVTFDAGITFHFAEPLSITSVTVAFPATEEIEWELINDAFKPVEVSGESSFQTWPVDEAPEWALKALEEILQREAKRIETQGPYFPTRRTLKYGEVPAGYREDLPAKKLAPGKHSLTVFAEQGNASTFFEVPAA
jgi:hypothetical protein